MVCLHPTQTLAGQPWHDQYHHDRTALFEQHRPATQTVILSFHASSLPSNYEEARTTPKCL